MISLNDSDIKKAYAVYTPLLLKIYNILVLIVSNNWVWRCPRSIQLEEFNKNISTHHLDIGVGTGYYLKHCQKPESIEISLMDINANCLASTKTLLKNYAPKVYLADVFKEQKLLSNQFDSISMNYVFHCLPGDMETKAIALANAVSLLKPEGVLFGATILTDKHLHTKISQRLNDFYIKKGVFSNQKDTLQALQQMLERNLSDVTIKVVGCVALFKGKKA